MKHRLPLLILLTFLAPRIGLAIMIGEPAPPLVVAEWLKGGPVVVQPGTNIFVVEIWSAASAASRACITNLNRLQERYLTNGVVFVGISDDPVERVRGFLQNAGTNIEYAVAADDRKKTSLSYMAAAKQKAIPFTFVVGTNGNVIWYGPPMAGLNGALHLIVTGEYDVERFKKSEIAAHQMQQYLSLAERGDARLKGAGAALLANRTNDFEQLLDMAYQISTAPRLARRDFALAGEALNQAEKLSPTNQAKVMIIRAVWLFASGKQDDGMIMATQALASAQSPVAKDNIQRMIGSMKALSAQAKNNQSQAIHPGPVSPPKSAPAADTNSPAAK